MRVQCLHDIAALEPYAEAWSRLAAGIPFRSWEWLATWWRHYGPAGGAGDRKRRLHVLGVFEPSGALAGLAPLYAEASAATGRVLRLLGDGEVCSEYLGMLSAPGREEAVAAAIAEYLARRSRATRSSPERWDLLVLEAVDADDPLHRPLLGHLKQLGAVVHCRPGPGCWHLALPDSWDDLITSRSKNQRRQFRRVLRRAEKRGTVLHQVECLSELTQAFEHLVDLHQRRWQSLGQPGCFASGRFLAFHRDVAAQMLRAGQLRMIWLEAEGKPLAAEYQLAAAGVIYMYQAGVDSNRLDWEPGHVATARVIQLAIDRGCCRFDFLRGNEPYKRQWGATFHGNTTIRVVAPRPGPRLRHHAWLAVRTAKDFARRGLKGAGMREVEPGNTTLPSPAGC